MDRETFDAILDIEKRHSIGGGGGGGGSGGRGSISWLSGAALVGVGIVIGAAAAIGYRSWKDKQEEIR